MLYAQYCRLHVHIGASDAQVVRVATRRMLAPSARKRDKRDARHAWLRAILGEHHEARGLFSGVTQ